MATLEIYDPENSMNDHQINEIVDFVYVSLGQYTDKKEHIKESVFHSLTEGKVNNGFVCIKRLDSKIVGVAVVNQTGMKKYIPENILVYFAVSQEFRKCGYGTEILNYVIEKTEGDIALHVDKSNPAIQLYEKLGFERKYLELRLYKGT